MKRTACWLWSGVLLLCALTPSWAQPKVAEVKVEGELNRVAESLIVSTLGLTRGVELSQENVQEAIRSLYGLNVFEDISIYANETPAGVDLTVKVKEYPALEGVRFRGNKQLKEKEMEETLDFVAGQVIAPRDVARGRQKILELYREKGYLRAQVNGQLFEADKGDMFYLQYDIDEGDKVKIRAINIFGNEAFDAGKIRKQMETKEKRWWRKGDFKAEVYDIDKEKILAFYRSEGYQQAIIAKDSIYYDDTLQKLFIDIHVDEGLEYHLGDIVWDGNSIIDEKTLRKQIKLKHGDVYKHSSQELAWLVRTAYNEKGYLDTEVMPIETIRGDSIDVRFQIFEGQPVRVRRVSIAGNTKTRENVLRRELEIRPGDIYQQSLVQESQRRLYMLNYFKDVQILPNNSEIDQQRAVDLTFQVEERPTGQASMGAGYSDRDKLVGTIGLQIPNFRGVGQNLDFSWEFGTRREQFLIGFTEPWLLGTPTSLSARLYTLNQQYFNSFDFKRNSASIRLGRRLQRFAYSTFSLGFQLRDESYRNFHRNYLDSYTVATPPEGDAEQSAFYKTLADSLVTTGRFAPRRTSSLELTYQRDTRDHPQFPNKGTVFIYRPEVASSFLGGQVDFHRHELQLNYYRPSWWKFVISVESKIGVVDGFSDKDDINLSFWDRYTPGGVDWWDGQVRGYPDASLGPRIGGSNIGGRSMMVLNMEYRFPISEEAFHGLLFFDAGNAWDKITDLNPRELRRSAGFGFRVMVPMMGLIGFDFGYGFDRKKVDGTPAGWSTHFQFGPRFF